MIVWREQKPDFRRSPVEDLLQHLPFTTACAVVLGSGIAPRVVLGRHTRQGIWAHLSERSVEMGGLLIGSVHEFRFDCTHFVVAVKDYIRSDAYQSTGVSLTMDTQVWSDARIKAEKGHSVIGWYHSHPNLGVFFSGTDRRTQSAFFNQDHSLGLVVDPIRKEEMWFMGGKSIALQPREVLTYSNGIAN